MKQKERIKEAKQIAFRFYCWLGYSICDDQDDELSLRKLVKRIEKEAVKKYKEGEKA